MLHYIHVLHCREHRCPQHSVHMDVLLHVHKPERRWEEKKGRKKEKKGKKGLKRKQCKTAQSRGRTSISFRVTLSIAAMWSASTACRKPNENAKTPGLILEKSVGGWRSKSEKLQTGMLTAARLILRMFDTANRTFAWCTQQESNTYNFVTPPQYSNLHAWVHCLRSEYEESGDQCHIAAN